MTEIEPMLRAESAGAEVTRFNALKHGVLSRYSAALGECGRIPRSRHCAHGRACAAGADRGPPRRKLAGIFWR